MTRDFFAWLQPKIWVLLVFASLAAGLVLGVAVRWFKGWRDRRWLWSGRYRPDDRDALAERAERVKRGGE